MGVTATEEKKTLAVQQAKETDLRTRNNALLAIEKVRPLCYATGFRHDGLMEVGLSCGVGVGFDVVCGPAEDDGEGRASAGSG